MKRYHVIHRNFVYHTEKQTPIKIIASDEPILSQDISENIQKKDTNTFIEQIVEEPCNEPRCLGGVQSDYQCGLWFLFEESRCDLCNLIKGKFPMILENDISEFIEWASDENNYEKTIFQHMIIEAYSEQYSPNFDKLVK